MATSPKWMTLREVAALTGRLEGVTCTERRARYLLVTCALGTELPSRRHGQTRLFGVLDAALLRLALRLEREGVSPWLTRVVLTYLRNDLVRAFRAASPLALAIRGIEGTLQPALRQRPGWAAAWVPLREVFHGLEAEVQKHCDTRDTVWMYKRVPVRIVPRSSG